MHPLVTAGFCCALGAHIILREGVTFNESGTSAVFIRLKYLYVFWCGYSDLIKRFFFVIFIRVCDENVSYIFQRFMSVINHNRNYKFFSPEIFPFSVSNPIYEYIAATVYRKSKNNINKL